VTARTSQPRVVALGGGHGLSASLQALRRVTDALTAVVTVADDGGSSGRLRAGYDLLPPGDLRMALAALAGDSPHAELLRDTLQHRFPAERPIHGGYAGLAGHPVGNLLLAGLFQVSPNPVAALDAAARLLELPPATRVLPMSTTPLDIAAEVGGLRPDGKTLTVRGQVEVATTRGNVIAVHLLPVDPPACPEAIEAIAAADALVLGPGSLFTSVLPHLLLPELRKAITAASATRILVLNLVTQPGETDGFTAESHLEVLGALVPELTLDWVIADESAVASERISPDVSKQAPSRGLMSGLRAAANDLGAQVHLAALARSASPGVHEPVALARAFATVLG
jgi:uncharacterized cofD-like protein